MTFYYFTAHCTGVPDIDPKVFIYFSALPYFIITPEAHDYIWICLCCVIKVEWNVSSAINNNVILEHVLLSR